MNGPAADWGTLKCGCHPDCGVGTAFMVSKRRRNGRRSRRSSTSIDSCRCARDHDAARGPFLTKLQTALSLLRNYSPLRTPRGFGLIDLVRKYDKQSGGQFGGVGCKDPDDRKSDEWLIMFVAGMWFQDLWTYDFRRTEMCIIPYATQMGEISFCAYNTGVGWRQIVENMYKSATVAEWYREHGKHAGLCQSAQAAPASRRHTADLAEDSKERTPGGLDAATHATPRCDAPTRAAYRSSETAADPCLCPTTS